MQQVRIAVDAAGGDLGVDATLPGCGLALASDPDLSLQVIGPEPVIEAWCASLSAAHAGRVDVISCEAEVGMADSPASALRRRGNTSMGRALQQVAGGTAGACVSGGNTGALMAVARYMMGTLPGIDRPAICSALPAIHGWTHVLDLGANVNVTAEMLTQFAVMGAAVSRITRNIDEPRVGLLNVGTEVLKGTDGVRQADRMLRDGRLNYIGFVEGHDIFIGAVDVVVCDGFVGNVALKCSEGLTRLMAAQVKQVTSASLAGRLAGMAAAPALKLMRGKFDPRHYNGASLLGLTGIVVKSHGAADAEGFANAIGTAALEARAGLAARIGEQMVDEMDAEETF